MRQHDTHNEPLIINALEDEDTSSTSLEFPPYAEQTTTDLTHNFAEVKVYKRRWWILAVYCMTLVTQGLLWNTWAPIGAALYIVYQWQPSFLALVLCMGCIGMAISAFPSTYIMEKKGTSVILGQHCCSCFNTTLQRMDNIYTYYTRSCSTSQ